VDVGGVGRRWTRGTELGYGYLDIDGSDLVRACIVGKAGDGVEAREIRRHLGRRSRIRRRGHGCRPYGVDGVSGVAGEDGVPWEGVRRFELKGTEGFSDLGGGD